MRKTINNEEGLEKSFRGLVIEAAYILRSPDDRPYQVRLTVSDPKDDTVPWKQLIVGINANLADTLCVDDFYIEERLG